MSSRIPQGTIGRPSTPQTRMALRDLMEGQHSGGTRESVNFKLIGAWLGRPQGTAQARMDEDEYMLRVQMRQMRFDDVA